MDERAQLVVLLAQFLAELQAFQISSKSVANRGSAAAHPLVQGQVPASLGIQVGAQSSQDQSGILQGVPAPTLMRHAEVRVGVSGGKGSFIG